MNKQLDIPCWYAVKDEVGVYGRIRSPAYIGCSDDILKVEEARGFIKWMSDFEDIRRYPIDCPEKRQLLKFVIETGRLGTIGESESTCLRKQLLNLLEETSDLKLSVKEIDLILELYNWKGTFTIGQAREFWDVYNHTIVKIRGG